MAEAKKRFPAVCLCILLMAGCAHQAPIPVDRLSAVPGGTITMGGKVTRLLGAPIAPGDPLPAVRLLDSTTMQFVDLSSLKGSVLFLSIVPSLDTKVCEAQTHFLAEEGRTMSPQIRRIVISRDSPFAQQRFARESKLQGLQYLTDYMEGAFGRATGLLVDNFMFLARTVIVADRDGRVRYIQVVPELTHLPDMESAFWKAEELVR